MRGASEKAVVVQRVAPWNALLYADLREARAAGRTPPQEPDFGEFDAHGVNCTDAPLAPPTREVRL